jgi:hypothetical protein
MFSVHQHCVVSQYNLPPPLPHAEIKGRDDVLAMGIDKYNEECRSIVMRWAAAADGDAGVCGKRQGGIA